MHSFLIIECIFCENKNSPKDIEILYSHIQRVQFCVKLLKGVNFKQQTSIVMDAYPPFAVEPSAEASYKYCVRTVGGHHLYLFSA